MCVICEPAAHAAAARVLNAARMERACPLHVRCGCLGGRGGRAPSQRRRGRCEGVRSPVHHPNSRRQTTVLSKISGAYTYRPQSTGNEAKSVLPCPRKVECMYEKVYSVVSAMTRTRVIDASLISHSTIVVMSLVAFSGVWRDVCLLCPLWVLARYRSEGKSLPRACALCSACDGART